MPTLKYFKITPNAPSPVFSTKSSACFDIFSHWSRYEKIKQYNIFNVAEEVLLNEDVFCLYPGYRVLMPTGLIFDIPEGYSVRIHPRSGLALKMGLILANCEAVIDEDYYHQTYILLHNVSKVNVIVGNDTRIAQAELVARLTYDFEEANVQPTQKTDRIGGLGSTGV